MRRMVLILHVITNPMESRAEVNTSLSSTLTLIRLNARVVTLAARDSFLGAVGNWLCLEYIYL